MLNLVINVPYLLILACLFLLLYYHYSDFLMNYFVHIKAACKRDKVGYKPTHFTYKFYVVYR